MPARAIPLVDVEWHRLHAVILPNPVPFDIFMEVTLRGELGSHYKVLDLRKLMKELRELLRERGEMWLASSLMINGKKQDMLTQLSWIKKSEGKNDSSINSEVASEKNATINRIPYLCPRVQIPSPLGMSMSLVSCERNFLSQNDAITLNEGNVSDLTSEDNFGFADSVVTNGKYSSPLFPVIRVLSRFLCHTGNTVVDVNIPEEYQKQFISRQLNLVVFPVTDIGSPAPWLKGNEISMIINGQVILTPWKRTWPSWVADSAKTYLFLDITKWISCRLANIIQHLQIDVHINNYTGRLLVAIACPTSESSVIECHWNSFQISDEKLQKFYHSILNDAVDNSKQNITFDSLDNASNDQSISPPTVDSLVNMTELHMDGEIIPLLCPISRVLIKIPVRGASCLHLRCMDLISYLRVSHIGSTWHCVLCDAPMTLSEIRYDHLLAKVVEKIGETYNQETNIYARLVPTVNYDSDNCSLVNKFDNSEKNQSFDSQIDIFSSFNYEWQTLDSAPIMKNELHRNSKRQRSPSPVERFSAITKVLSEPSDDRLFDILDKATNEEKNTKIFSEKSIEESSDANEPSNPMVFTSDHEECLISFQKDIENKDTNSLEKGQKNWNMNATYNSEGTADFPIDII